MIAKLIEIRDRHTRIDVVCFETMSQDETENHYFRHVGFTGELPWVMVFRLADRTACYSPMQWKDQRTMMNAHEYIAEHYSELKSGDVVDVEFILGEKDSPSLPERMEYS
jgi:hypothetical protein